MYGLTSNLVAAPKEMNLGASGYLADFWKLIMTIGVFEILPFLFEVILRVLVILGWGYICWLSLASCAYMSKSSLFSLGFTLITPLVNSCQFGV